MAAKKDALQQLLRNYVDTGDGEEALKEILQTTSVAVRYKALMDIQSRNQSTAVHEAVSNKDLDSLKFMLSGFPSDKHYDIVKILSSSNCTAVHLAAAGGYTEITMFLLNNLSLEQRLDILKIRDNAGRTALHRAAVNKQLTELKVLLTSVSPEQREELLNIRDSNDNIVADVIKLFDLPYDVAAWTKIELDTTNQKLTKVEKQQEATVDKLKAYLAKQRGDNATQVKQQTQELAETNQRVTTMETLYREQKEETRQQGQELADTNQNVITMGALGREQTEENQRQGQELAEMNQKLTILETLCTEQTKEKQQQAKGLSDANQRILTMQEQLNKQKEEQDEANRKFQASEKLQKATIEQLKVDLVRQREDNTVKVEQLELDNLRQAQELRSLVDRQERMENMMEEMERLLGQPICIGPEMDQEHEDH